MSVWKTSRESRKYSASTFIDVTVNCGICWMLEPDGHLWRYTAVRPGEAVPGGVWENFGEEFEQHRSLIVAEIRRRVGPSGGLIFAGGAVGMSERTAAGAAPLHRAPSWRAISARRPMA